MLANQVTEDLKPINHAASSEDPITQQQESIGDRFPASDQVSRHLDRNQDESEALVLDAEPASDHESSPGPEPLSDLEAAPDFASLSLSEPERAPDFESLSDLARAPDLESLSDLARAPDLESLSSFEHGIDPELLYNLERAANPETQSEFEFEDYRQRVLSLNLEVEYYAPPSMVNDGPWTHASRFEYAMQQVSIRKQKPYDFESLLVATDYRHPKGLRRRPSPYASLDNRQLKDRLPRDPTETKASSLSYIVKVKTKKKSLEAAKSLTGFAFGKMQDLKKDERFAATQLMLVSKGDGANRRTAFLRRNEENDNYDDWLGPMCAITPQGDVISLDVARYNLLVDEWTRQTRHMKGNEENDPM